MQIVTYSETRLVKRHRGAGTHLLCDLCVSVSSVLIVALTYT